MRRAHYLELVVVILVALGTAVASAQTIGAAGPNAHQFSTSGTFGGGIAKPLAACSEGVAAAPCLCTATRIPAGDYCCSGTAQTWACQLIDEDANTVSHVKWTGAAITDTKSVTWTMNGTVAQVGGSGRTPPGAGPYPTTGTYYFSGTGSDVMDFAGDFTVVIVFKPASVHNGTLVSDGVASTAGWIAQLTNLGTQYGRSDNYRAGGNDSAVTTQEYVTTVPNVMCAGRSGLTHMVQMNSGTLGTKALTTITAGTSQQLRIGVYTGGANPFNGIIYEIMATSTAASGAACTSYIATAKARLGLTTEW